MLFSQVLLVFVFLLSELDAGQLKGVKLSLTLQKCVFSEELEKYSDEEFLLDRELTIISSNYAKEDLCVIVSAPQLSSVRTSLVVVTFVCNGSKKLKVEYLIPRNCVSLIKEDPARLAKLIAIDMLLQVRMELALEPRDGIIRDGVAEFIVRRNTSQLRIVPRYPRRQRVLEPNFIDGEE